MKTSTKSNNANLKSIFWLGILLLLFIISLNFVLSEIKYFGLKEETLGRYWDIKWWLVGHLSSGMLALTLGPFQFWTKFRNKYLKMHRLMGKIYLLAIIIGSLASIYMAWNISVKLHFTWALSLQILCFAWLATAFMAYRAIRKRRIQQHKEWMIRSYIVTFVFVSFRWINDLLGAIEIGTFIERAPTIIYLTLFLPLFIVEIIFQWNKK